MSCEGGKCATVVEKLWEAQMKKRNETLNFLKGLACFAVVFIHSHFPGITGDVVWRLAQWAVPVFFMISGYYAYSGDREWLRATLARRRGHILRLSVYATLFYLAIQLVTWAGKGVLFHSPDWGLLAESLVKFALVQAVEPFGGHLWFLWALLYAYIIMEWINRCNAWRAAYRLMWLLFIVKIALSGVDTPLDWHLTGNWLLSGLPYVLMGRYIAEHRDYIFAQARTPQLLAVGTLGALYSLYRLTGYSGDLSELGIVMLALALFVWATKKPAAIHCPTLAKIGDAYSLNIYIFHVLVIKVVQKIVKLTHCDDSALVLWLTPILVVAASLLLAIALEKIKTRLIPGAR